MVKICCDPYQDPRTVLPERVTAFSGSALGKAKADCRDDTNIHPFGAVITGIVVGMTGSLGA